MPPPRRFVYVLKYDVTRDGRFLINAELDEAAAPITLIQNWNPDGKQER